MSNDERIAILETTVQHTNATLVSIGEQLRHLSDRMDHKFDKIDPTNGRHQRPKCLQSQKECLESYL